MGKVFVNIDARIQRLGRELGCADEEIALAPVVFGGGRRLFDNLREPRPRFRIDKVLDSPDATHLRYMRA